MKESFLHLLSETKGIFRINGQYLGTIDNKTNMELDVISHTKSIFVTFEPIEDSPRAIPYTFSLNTEDSPRSSNEYIKIVPFPNNHYDIVMKPFYYYQISQSEILFNGNVGKFFVSIIADNITRITIFSGASIVFSYNVERFSFAKVEEHKEKIIIQGVINDNQYRLIIINTEEFKVIYDDISHSIEETNEYICSYKKINTICNHALVWKFTYSDNNIEKYYVYENAPKKEINNILIPYAFLQCVSIGDESMAKNFLSNKFATTSINQLQEYFNKIDEIYLNRHNFSFAKQNYTIKSSSMKNYNFLIDNSRIQDIEEVF